MYCILVLSFTGNFSASFEYYFFANRCWPQVLKLSTNYFCFRSEINKIFTLSSPFSKIQSYIFFYSKILVMQGTTQQTLKTDLSVSSLAVTCYNFVIVSDALVVVSAVESVPVILQPKNPMMLWKRFLVQGMINIGIEDFDFFYHNFGHKQRSLGPFKNFVELKKWMENRPVMKRMKMVRMTPMKHQGQTTQNLAQQICHLSMHHFSLVLKRIKLYNLFKIELCDICKTS